MRDMMRILRSPADPGRWPRIRCPACTPTVPNSRRVTELKKVLQNSLSGRPSIRLLKCRLTSDHSACSRTLRPSASSSCVHGRLHAAFVQFDAFDRILVAAVPVARREAGLRAAGDIAEVARCSPGRLRPPSGHNAWRTAPIQMRSRPHPAPTRAPRRSRSVHRSRRRRQGE